MSILQAIVLGIVQGATEFLPISSSAHLVLTPWVLNWTIDDEISLAFNALVQVGTIVAVFAYFWDDLWRLARAAIEGLLKREPFGTTDARLAWLVVLATVPGVVFGVLAADLIEAAFESPVGVSAILLANAALLTVAERIGSRTRPLDATDWRDALLMGVFQALAIFPGISRSGSTIVGGMLRGLTRPAAARFSFFMSVPILIGAGVFTGADLVAAGNLLAYLDVLVIGFVAAAIVGYLSIHWLLRYVANNPLYPFAVYCAVLGIGGLVFSVVRG